MSSREKRVYTRYRRPWCRAVFRPRVVLWSCGFAVSLCVYTVHVHAHAHVGQRMLIAVIKNYNNKQRAGKRSGSIENRKVVKREWDNL